MIENPLITGTITARRLSEAVAEANGYNWVARCTGYRLEGTGDDSDEAIDDLVSQIRRAHQKSRMVLKNPDKLEIDYDIIRVTASIRIGDNPNKSLADFMPEEKEQKQEDKTSLAYYVSEVLGFKTEDEFKKHLEEDPSRAARIDLGYKCWLFRKIEGATEERSSTPEESGVTILGVSAEDWKKEGVSKIDFSSPGHEPVSIVIGGAEATAVPEEEKKDIPQDAAERCNSCGNCCDERDGNVRCFWHQDFFKPDSIEECDKYVTREEAEKVTPCVWFGTQETPCDSCPYYGKSCKGTDYDKSCCDMFPPCVGCRHNKGTKYDGVVGNAYEYVVMCEDKLKPVNNQMRITDCRGWHSKDMEGKK